MGKKKIIKNKYIKEMVCPAKTVALISIAVIVYVFGFQVDTDSWKKKIFGTGLAGRIKYYIFIFIVIIFHLELLTNGHFTKKYVLSNFDPSWTQSQLDTNSADTTA